MKSYRSCSSNSSSPSASPWITVRWMFGRSMLLLTTTGCLSKRLLQMSLRTFSVAVAVKACQTAIVCDCELPKGARQGIEIRHLSSKKAEPSSQAYIFQDGAKTMGFV